MDVAIILDRLYGTARDQTRLKTFDLTKQRYKRHKTNVSHEQDDAKIHNASDFLGSTKETNDEISIQRDTENE